VGDYLKRRGITFPVGRDNEQSETFEGYSIRYIPQVVLIDKKGLVRHYQGSGRLLELVKSYRREAAG